MMVTKVWLPDSEGGGAWPFLVGEVACLVNSDNGRDSTCVAYLRTTPSKGGEA